VTWRWLSRSAVAAIHDEQLAEHGGAPGLRDGGLLESALARAQHAATYASPDTATLAAAYAFGIIRKHPFVDGNKRTGFVVGATFLLLNELDLGASEQEVVERFWRLAEGSLSEEELAASFRANLRPRS
jgi:death on curing protein